VTYGYAPDGNAGPPLRELAAWGTLPAGGTIGPAEPLFPRLETEESDESRGGGGRT